MCRLVEECGAAMEVLLGLSEGGGGPPSEWRERWGVW